jgi:hypothetical protein
MPTLPPDYLASARCGGAPQSSGLLARSDGEISELERAAAQHADDRALVIGIFEQIAPAARASLC